jgi:hypothetical protein
LDNPEKIALRRKSLAEDMPYEKVFGKSYFKTMSAFMA